MSTDGSALGYAELLKLASANGLQELDCTIVQIPAEQNAHHGVVLAAVRTSRGLFRAVGEAWRDSLPAAQREQTLTVAESRAKTRALCEAVGMPQPLAASVPARPSEPVAAASPSSPSGAPRTADPRPPTVAAVPDAPATPAKVNATRPSAPDPSDQPAPRRGQGTEPPVPARPPAARTAPTPVESSEPAEDVGRAARQAPARPAARSALIPVETMGPDMLAKLLQMTRRKASMEGNPATEEEALRRLDSYFQRAFGHELSEASRMEGQRVVQRLAADLARMSTDSGGMATG